MCSQKDRGEAPSGRLKEKVRRLPDRPGVYLMKDRLGRIIYVGKARSLHKRVSSYFQAGRSRVSHPKIRALIGMIADFDTVEVKSEPEALLLEGKLIKQWRPRYNTDFTDDKRFLLVRVDPGEELPRFRLTRIRKDDRSHYFGPFAHSGLLRKTLAQMRRRFGILLGDASPQRMPDGSWQLYADVRREIYGFPNQVNRDEYLVRVADACDFLKGKSREWLEALRAEMASAAEKQEFEKAAELRDVIFALGKTLAKTRHFERMDPTRVTAGETAMRLLGQALGLPSPPDAMECFDISHISGTYVVASMVRFAGGKPDKDHYRRFRIKTFVGNDDFRAMEEVVGRRYSRLRDEGRPFPDLVVIDGGRGQVAAALKAFMGSNCRRRSSVLRRRMRRSFSRMNARHSISRSATPDSSCSSGCVMRRTASQTRTMRTCAQKRSESRCSMTLRGWATCGARRFSGILGTSTGCAPPPRRKSPRFRASGRNSPESCTLF